jgi:two-component system NtrC family sensor kinase
LGVDNRTSSQPFLEQELTLVSTLADYAAIAIENAQLFEKTEVERDKLQTILSGIGDGVIVVGDDHRVILANRPAAEAFNVNPSDVINQPVEQVFHHEQLIEMLQDEELEYPYRCELALDDGRVMNAQLTKIQEVGSAVTIQDITHLKELDRIKSDFVSTVSHDLRSPLTAILGYVELIARVGPINAQQNEFIKRVQVSVRNITTLINDLLELGRIESGFDARKEFVPMPMVLQYSLDSLGSSIMEKKHEILVDVPDSVDKVFGDPTRLRQLVDNLLSNAIRYTPVGGQVRVSLRSENDQVIFQVEDTGSGIPPSDQPYIFDKFYRASNVEQDIPGSGLGLAIVKSIVENHQGRVWVDSALGQGSTFTVVLPTAEDVL